MRFVGNVEGRDLYNGNVDVVVCDGFVGNVALKTSEGLVKLVNTPLRESLKSTITSTVGALLSQKAFKAFAILHEHQHPKHTGDKSRSDPRRQRQVERENVVQFRRKYRQRQRHKEA